MKLLLTQQENDMVDISNIERDKAIEIRDGLFESCKTIDQAKDLLGYLKPDRYSDTDRRRFDDLIERMDTIRADMYAIMAKLPT